MEISLFLLFRITVGFLIGFALVRRFNGPLRALVVRLMPMKYRISEKSFIHQARFTTLASIAIALLIGGGIYRGTDLLANRLKKEPAPILEVKTKPKPIELSPLMASQVPEEPFKKPEPAEPAPATDPQTQPSPAPVIVAARPKPAPVVITEESFFLQVSAFEEEVYAWDQKERLEKRHSGKVWVAFASADYIPYKVLVGPFPDRKSAMAYRRQKKLGGFARALKELRLFAK